MLTGQRGAVEEIKKKHNKEKQFIPVWLVILRVLYCSKCLIL